MGETGELGNRGTGELGTGNRELSNTWSAVVMFFSDLKGVLLPNTLFPLWLRMMV